MEELILFKHHFEQVVYRLNFIYLEFSYDDKTVAVNFLHALLTKNQNDPGVQIVTDFCDGFVGQYQQEWIQALIVIFIFIKKLF